jgi:hypothetical protein
MIKSQKEEHNEALCEYFNQISIESSMGMRFMNFTSVFKLKFMVQMELLTIY